MKWEEMFAGRFFISDLGSSQDVTDENNNLIALGRYAVWSPMTNASNHMIVEVGDNLGSLMAKYNISSDYVCILA